MKQMICALLFACLLLTFAGCQSSKPEQESQQQSGVGASSEEMSQAGLDDNPFTDEVPEKSEAAEPPIEQELHSDPLAPEQNSVSTEVSHAQPPKEEQSSAEIPSKEQPSKEIPSKEEPSKEVKPNTALTYEEYSAMTGAQQQQHYLSFANPDDFFDWYNAAKAKYDETHSGIEIGSDGIIDLGNQSGSN